MKISESAEKKLQDMLARLGEDVTGFRITGFMGTCRGSTPILEPIAAEVKTDVMLLSEPVLLYVADEYADLMDKAQLDYESGFMGKGLVMIWPHHEGCPCQTVSH